MFAENKSVPARLQDLLKKKQKGVQPFDCTVILFILFGFHISSLRNPAFSAAVFSQAAEPFCADFAAVGAACPKNIYFFQKGAVKNEKKCYNDM